MVILVFIVVFLLTIALVSYLVINALRKSSRQLTKRITRTTSGSGKAPDDETMVSTRGLDMYAAVQQGASVRES